VIFTENSNFARDNEIDFSPGRTENQQNLFVQLSHKQVDKDQHKPTGPNNSGIKDNDKLTELR